ncbi:MAG TPA: phosphate acetyltransferase [Chitinispirillaceae bacterium]|nr:phosphate acetyltransferase [Chitinispirillaceae bacterium]
MELMNSFYERAKKLKKTILFPEGTEPRTIKAVSEIARTGLARPILIGEKSQVEAKAASEGVSLEGITIIDPPKDPRYDMYVNKFYELRKAKGMTIEKAYETLKDPVYFATMLIQFNEADGLVSGAEHSTADTIRPALQIIKTRPGISVVSGCFIMIVPNSTFGDNGLFVFADCAVNPDPTSEQLAEIAIASADTARNLCGMNPKVAMLSFSTKKSAQHPNVDKVVKAFEIAKEKAPNLEIDGELQADAALVASVGQKKCPGSTVAGKANVLIFPDLQSGNIGYKLVERLAKAHAIGPFLQGLNKPVNDLSRGCSVQDIIDVTAVTAIQADAK